MNINKFIKIEKINSIFKYSLIKYLALLIGFVKGIVNARVLGPELLGVLGNLLLVLSYLGYSNFGILFSMNREYVIHEANNEMVDAKKVINTSFTSISILSIFLLVIGISTKFIYKGELGNYIVLIFIIGILEQYRSFYTNYFRLVNDFEKINYIELINNILSLKYRASDQTSLCKCNIVKIYSIIIFSKLY